ncbi:hypothetical protein [Dyella acidiphila]|uniref:DUF3159 domain-containing protein n=1 Tax=Dyella acidiphila TaxID=2775866 RepID=A0ABR9G5Q4_9GAMM|nr:hypothetical protein [Dyella acidiphila]MBE1159375.1 hypothetical protein [Dyella acidiphila]
MTRFTQKQYEAQTLWAMLVYCALILFVWPLLRAPMAFGLKLLGALAPALPVIYLIFLLARRIRASDEFEQRTHLAALGVAAAVTSVLGLIGGFLSMAKVVQLDGTVLIWVFPVIMWSYSLARWYVLRRYGERSWCSEEASSWYYLRFALLGVVVIAVIWLYPPALDSYRLGFVYGTAGGIAGAGLATAFIRWRRQRQRD